MADDKSKAAPAADQKAVPMGRAIVARGRTVIGDHPTDLRPAGSTDDGKQIMKPLLVHYAPGEEVTLPVAEITRLRGLGYLVDPDAAVLQTGLGPDFAPKA